LIGARAYYVSNYYLATINPGGVGDEPVRRLMVIITIPEYEPFAGTLNYSKTVILSVREIASAHACAFVVNNTCESNTKKVHVVVFSMRKRHYDVGTIGFRDFGFDVVFQRVYSVRLRKHVRGAGSQSGR
jgi:hypothetical protein